MIKNIFATILLASAIACGGQIDSTDDAQDMKAPPSFEPFTAYATAKAHAAKYCSNPAAIDLGGELSSDRKSYSWTWRFQCDGQVFVMVAAGPNGVRVTSHGLRTWLMGVTKFDPNTVKVNATDLLSILKKQGYPQPDEMDLGEALVPKATPKWSVSAGKRSVSVDAMSGKVDG